MIGRALRTAVLIAAVGLSASACDASGDLAQPDETNTASASAFSAPTRRPPANKGTCSTSQDCPPLTIHTSGGSDHYLVFKDSSTGRKAASIYIEANETYRGGMPIGTYDLYYTAGRNWYGKKLFFGPESRVSKADSRLEFYETAGGLSGVELTLYAVEGGNLSALPGELDDLS